MAGNDALGIKMSVFYRLAQQILGNRVPNERVRLMNILYHMTNLPPKLSGTEASLQELNTLKDHFGGEVVFINPNQSSPIYLPRLLFGFHLLKDIRAKENFFQAHHLYNADPFPFPVLAIDGPILVFSIHWLRLRCRMNGVYDDWNLGD
jgi:hypothetical protein